MWQDRKDEFPQSHAELMNQQEAEQQSPTTIESLGLPPKIARILGLGYALLEGVELIVTDQFGTKHNLGIISEFSAGQGDGIVYDTTFAITTHHHEVLCPHQSEEVAEKLKEMGKMKPSVLPPIPPDYYWHPQIKAFFGCHTRVVCSSNFHDKWESRCMEFPTYETWQESRDNNYETHYDPDNSGLCVECCLERERWQHKSCSNPTNIAKDPIPLDQVGVPRFASVYDRLKDLEMGRKQVDGDHYDTMAIDPCHFCDVNKHNPYQFSMIKHASRYPNKNEAVTDLKKVIDYAQLALQRQYGIESKIVFGDENGQA